MKDKVSLLLSLVLIGLLAIKGYEYYQSKQQQGVTAKPVNLTGLNNQPISVIFDKKQVLIFWATWCGPCSIELGRLNAMIEKGQIKADSILAISIQEDPSTVAKFVNEKKYQFPVALDLTGQVAADYKVRGTPTLYLIDEFQKINWVSVGVSPSLEFRLNGFLGN